MDSSILVAIIEGAITLGAVIITARSTQNKVMQELKTSNEVQNTKLEHLTEEVRKHNNFAQRIPVIEGDIKLLNEKINVANHRIADLEKAKE